MREEKKTCTNKAVTWVLVIKANTLQLGEKTITAALFWHCVLTRPPCDVTARVKNPPRPLCRVCIKGFAHEQLARNPINIWRQLRVRVCSRFALVWWWWRCRGVFFGTHLTIWTHMWAYCIFSSYVLFLILKFNAWKIPTRCYNQIVASLLVFGNIWDKTSGKNVLK